MVCTEASVVACMAAWVVVVLACIVAFASVVVVVVEGVACIEAS